ncbi:MAG: hypothetical protein CVU84_16915 [Firmicutes bacterium HGW-Firmicutes-1]|jgi:predicted  nucleic acid-binding Zn-ribbon protein|nr:MAG: hypothetical protein CVU84_16915 [Firmicutes bacterium HGW-Firmicutes-1]
MYCAKCGAHYESVAQSFCGQCGNTLFQDSSIDKSNIKNKATFDIGEPEIIQEERIATVTDQAKKTKGSKTTKNSRIITWIIGGIMLLGFIGFMGFLILSGALSSDTLESLSDTESIRVAINDTYFKYASSITDLKVFGNVFLTIIIVCSVALLIIRKCRTFFQDECLTGPVHMINQIVFIGVCIVEILFGLSQGPDMLSFCDPFVVGWIQAGIRFVGFVAIVYNQLMTYIDNMGDLQYNAKTSVDFSLGFFSWPIAIVLTIIISFIDASIISFIWILFALVQMIQIIMILAKVIPKGGILRALYMVFAYCVGAIGTVFIAYILLLVVLFIMIGATVIYIASLGSSSLGASSSNKCPNCGRRLNNYNECSNCGIGVSS